MAARMEGDMGQGLEAEGAEGWVGVGAGSRLEGQQLGLAGCSKRSHLQEGKHRAGLEGGSPEEAEPDQSKQGKGQAQGRGALWSPWR